MDLIREKMAQFVQSGGQTLAEGKKIDKKPIVWTIPGKGKPPKNPASALASELAQKAMLESQSKMSAMHAKITNQNDSDNEDNKRLIDSFCANDERSDEESPIKVSDEA